MTDTRMSAFSSYTCFMGEGLEGRWVLRKEWLVSSANVAPRSLESYIVSLKANLRIYHRILALLRPHWLWVIGTLVCVALSTVLALVVPIVLGWVIDVGTQSGRMTDLWLAAGGILVLSALRGLFAYGQGYLSQAVSNLVAYDLRNMLYRHLQRLSFSFHDDSETGQLMSRMTIDIEAVRNFFPLALLRAALAVVTFVAVAGYLWSLDALLALVTLTSVPLLLLLSIQVAQQLRPLWFNVQNENGALSTVMQENLSGVRVVKSFAREDFEMEKFDGQNRKLRELNLNAMRLSARNQPMMVLVLNMVTVVVVWIGGIAVVGKHLSIGTLAVVTQYVLLLGNPVRTFGFMVTWFMRGLSGGERIFSVLDTEPVIQDAPHAQELQNIEGRVRYEHVSFAYGMGPEVLHDITIDAEPGKTIALLGATGSGKSTALHLLPRFYDVTDGKITIDGYDIREVTQASLRRNVALVLQDVFLFNATLHDNIAFGVQDATDEQIMAAAKVARLHDFIMTLPDGYETWVGERGVTLSGGQKQRLAIARTLLLDPRILILDDATSSVDTETEYLIQQALEAVMRGRTSFVVASRLRTIKNADQILVLDEGRIVERGNHHSLLALNGAYKRLYDIQLREQEEMEGRVLQTTVTGSHPVVKGERAPLTAPRSEVAR
jgi:ABC-type multidrug transport system fused ATPase/permease subunit